MDLTDQHHPKNFIHQAKPWGAIDPRRLQRIKLVSLADLSHLPPREQIIKNLLGKGELSVWFGQPGCGKSFFLMTTALSLARGIDWYGRKVMQGPVVYIAAEGSGGIRNRFDAYKKHHGLTDDVRDNIPFRVIPTTVDLYHPRADTDAIVYRAKELEFEYEQGCIIIVVDTLNRAIAGADENSSRDMGLFLANCDRIRHETGAHVAIVHHTPKAERTSPRGHSSLLGAVDVAVKIEKKSGGNVATVVKAKDDEDGWSTGFRLAVVELDIDEDGDAITSCVVEPWEPPQDNNIRVTGHTARALEALDHVLTHNGVVRDVCDAPENPPCVDIFTWRTEFYERTDGTKDTKQKAFKRAMSHLQDKGVIEFRDGTVWKTVKKER